MTSRFNVVESISKKVHIVQSILILKITLLERRYTSIIHVATNCIPIDSLSKGLGVKLFHKQVTKMSLTKPFGVKD